MNFTTLQKTLGRIFRNVRYGSHPKPYRDWFWILIVTLTLLIGSVGWSYYVFLSTSSDDSGTSAVSLKRTLPTIPLDAVKHLFMVRAEERAHYLSDYHFVDPSRPQR
ncbi:MAG: hypothetical protein AAB472_03715 [Patescibacteria group bacterium]